MFIGKKEFYEKYTTTGNLLGKGGNGSVYAGYRNSDRFPVAIKVVGKKRLVRGTVNQKNVEIPIEVALMTKARHIKGVIKLIDYSELPGDCFVMVMERKVNDIDDQCKDLFDFITDRHREKGLTEELARKIFRQIAETVGDLQKLDILHGDIKDENILINTQTHDIKLIDFGAGTKLLEDKLYTTFCGTRIYAPPEWIQHRWYTAAGLNVWSLGVLLYDLLCGDIPFKTENDTIDAKISFPPTLNLSDPVKDLIKGCLTVSTKDRFNLQDVLKHPWLLRNQTNTALSTTSLPNPSQNQPVMCLTKPFTSSNTISLAMLETQLESMVVKNVCHKPLFRKILRLLMLPLSCLFAGMQSGCIVGEMV